MQRAGLETAQNLLFERNLCSTNNDRDDHSVNDRGAREDCSLCDEKESLMSYYMIIWEKCGLVMREKLVHLEITGN